MDGVVAQDTIIENEAGKTGKAGRTKGLTFPQPIVSPVPPKPKPLEAQTTIVTATDLQKRAELGDADAQFNLGNCYSNGDGVLKDDAEAVKWYQKAAEQGNARAQCSLGLCYAHGTGVPKDEAEAVKWYHKAAEQGDVVAPAFLDMAYRYGNGVSKDMEQAAMWRIIADERVKAAIVAAQEKILTETFVELNALEGLASVKADLNQLVSFLKIQKERSNQGMKTSNQALHYVFTGNPDTGKTTVARILAKIFYGFGILKLQKLTETDRSGLVGGYVGQTAIKTDKLIKKSLDGVLFIDEAYSLEKKGSGEDFGQEAIDTLLKRMEDYRDQLIVIVAGYPKLMQNFIASNPGLQSRFTRYLTFEDYSIPEMCRIYEKMCRNEEYELTPMAYANVCILFSLAFQRKNEHFGNGRFVRNVYENTTMKQSSRLASLPQITKKVLLTIEASDIPFEMIAGFDASKLDLSQSQWNSTCPDCQKNSVVNLEAIGQSFTCDCGKNFVFPWWEPVSLSIGGDIFNVLPEDDK